MSMVDIPSISIHRHSTGYLDTFYSISFKKIFLEFIFSLGKQNNINKYTFNMNEISLYSIFFKFTTDSK